MRNLEAYMLVWPQFHVNGKLLLALNISGTGTAQVKGV